MAGDNSTVERAFELAKSGDCRTIDQIRKRLKAERYVSVDAHLESRALRGQLRELLRGSQA